MFFRANMFILNFPHDSNVFRSAEVPDRRTVCLTEKKIACVHVGNMGMGNGEESKSLEGVRIDWKGETGSGSPGRALWSGRIPRTMACASRPAAARSSFVLRRRARAISKRGLATSTNIFARRQQQRARGTGRARAGRCGEGHGGNSKSGR